MRKKKKKRVFRVVFPLTVILIVIFGIVFCFINVMPMSSNKSDITFKINEGDRTKEIIHKLKQKKLIRMENFIYVYVKINNINNIKSGTFKLSKNMSVNDIFKTITDSKNAISTDITITFPEGKNMRKVAEIIEDNTKYSYDDVLNTIKDENYIKKLISKYWFLDDIILNKNIYYSLEGYLAPDTYNFKKDVTIKEIFEVLLDETETTLSKYKSKDVLNNYSIHEFITLASIIDSEGGNYEEKRDIAGVFINRLKANMPLGSDVTTYYASKIELGERDLYKKEINSDNPYNTRASSNAGKLPIGPICNPSKESLEAAINYKTNDYYYFVADKNGKIYFSKNSSEHDQIIKKLKKENLWYEY